MRFDIPSELGRIGARSMHARRRGYGSGSGVERGRALLMKVEPAFGVERDVRVSVTRALEVQLQRTSLGLLVIGRRQASLGNGVAAAVCDALREIDDAGTVEIER